jgi:hypothetical protein
MLITLRCGLLSLITTFRINTEVELNPAFEFIRLCKNNHPQYYFLIIFALAPHAFREATAAKPIATYIVRPQNASRH